MSSVRAALLMMLMGLLAGCSSQPERTEEPSKLEHLLGKPSVHDSPHQLTPMRRVLKRAYVEGLKRTCVYAIDAEDGNDHTVELQRAWWQPCPDHPEQAAGAVLDRSPGASDDSDAAK